MYNEYRYSNENGFKNKSFACNQLIVYSTQAQYILQEMHICEQQIFHPAKIKIDHFSCQLCIAEVVRFDFHSRIFNINIRAHNVQIK